MWTSYGQDRATADAGTLRLYVWHVGGVKDEDGGIRKRYGYRLSDDKLNTAGIEAYDLYSGVGAGVDAQDALTTLVAFLTAAGEAYRSTMGDPNKMSENHALFPDWVNESAYMNDSELAELALDLNGPSTGAATAPKTAHPRQPPPSTPDVPRL
ncbi:hypothetical protein NBCG_01551 [Nocardioidaceae bacterium Broad-1]|nr:hypothetical protein NBCG_01551 [Nocardioidaceae bacterium Broad-1]